MKIINFEKKINYKFKDKNILELAFTHSSFKSKDKANSSYERLEFLGDRVLSLVIANILFQKFPNEDEGALSKRHSDLVSKGTLIDVAKQLNIKNFLKLDNPEKKYLKKQNNNSIISDVCESLIGAIFLDSNINEAEKFIKKFWDKKISQNISPPQDSKSLLQEIAQSKNFDLPKYNLKSKRGPSHNPEFEIEVSLKGLKKFIAYGKTIKIAETKAASELINFMRKKKLF